MAKGKDHHVFVSEEDGDDANDGTESFPVKTVEAAKRVMVQRGYDKCTGIRIMSGKVTTSPCGEPRCGSCTKANGRRPCPGPGCDKWISVSAKQHECGWRKPEAEKKAPQPSFVYKENDHHGFEKLKRKMVALARQAAIQYGWDGIIMGYAPKVGRGGSTARISFASPQNELYTVDERGSLKVHAGLDDHLSINADNALTLIRHKICPAMYSGERGMMKHEGQMLAADEHHDVDDHHGLPVQGPELPHGMEDKHEINELQMHWLQQAAEKQRASELAEQGGVGHPAPAAIHPAMLAAQHLHLQQQQQHHHHHLHHHSHPHPHPHPHAHMQAMGIDPLHLPMEAAVAMEDHKRKHMMQLEALHKRSRHDD